MTRARSARRALPGARRVFHASILQLASILGLAPLFAIALSTGSARADVNTIDVGTGPVVRINIRQGPVAIRTWDRESVQVDGDPAIVVTRKPYRGALGFGSLPMAAAGKADSDTFLPAESFVPGIIPPGPRDSVLIRSDTAAGGGPVTITIPNDSPLVFAIARGGTLDVRGYRGGTLVGYTTFGRLSIENSGGTAFLQTNRGPIVINDSTFERIRTRSLQGNITYERCVVHQIETTALDGSIVYDGGSFQPGLARFESQRGDVAVGSESAAELSAHTASGRIFSSFLAPASVRGGNAETHATVDGGGPLVTAASETGNVYLYDGSLKSRNLPPEWQAPTATLARPGIRREDATARRPFSPEPGIRRVKFRDFPRPGFRR